MPHVIAAFEVSLPGGATLSVGNTAHRCWQRLRSERFFLCVLVIALLLPLATSRAHDIPFFGLPIVTSGDEPHYLIAVHSLISDGDLDLSNNYDAARRGAPDIGLGRAFAPIDHQSGWYGADGAFHAWSSVFRYPTNARGDLLAAPALPELKPGASREFIGRPEYSQHPPGLPLLLAPLSYFVRGTGWVEHLALFWSSVATFGCVLFLRQLFRGFSEDRAVVNAATLLAILGSPTWHYGRTLFCEPWLSLFAVGALALATRRSHFFLAGCFIAAGIQMKPPFALLAMPLLADRLMARDLKRAATFSVPIVFSVALVLLENTLLFGAPFRTAQPWASGNVFVGLIAVLFAANHGLIPFCPAVLVSLLGWPRLIRHHRREAVLALAMALPYVFLFSLWWSRSGGYCYGPRLIAPIIPLLLLGIVEVVAQFGTLSVGTRRVAAGLCTLSVLISALGAVVHLAFWDKHPLIEPFVALAKR